MIERNVETIYPLSPLQQGLLFHTLYDPDSAEYFEQFSFPLEGPLDADAFERAWQQVVARHPVLRTAFVWEGLDQPRQVVQRRVELPFERHDWSELPQAERRRRLDRLAIEDRSRGFRLTRAPLMRVVLIRLGAERHQLIWSHHHLLLDGWSVSLVISEVFSCYRALVRGETLRLPPGRPFRDYVRWLERQDRGAARGFFERMFQAYAPGPALVNGRPEAAAGGDGYGRLQRSLSAARSVPLQRFAAAQGLTLNTLVQGAWALLLGRYGGHLDVVFGVTSSGRPVELEGVETMVGLFVNTLPLRVHGGWEEPLGPWLERLQEESSLLRQFEYSPLIDVLEWSGAGRQRKLFDTILAFENFPVDPDLAQADDTLSIPELTSVWERTNYPLTAQVSPGEDLGVTLLYDRGLFSTSAVERLVGHLRQLLSGMRDPGLRLGDLPLLEAGERHQLLYEAGTDGGGSGDDRLDRLFERRAVEAPTRAAVTCGAEELEYGELDRRANRLAHRLKQLDVRPGGPVAVCLERSLDLVTTILAVLKAGGTYVPLDPAYPEERLSFLLCDAGAPLVVTQERFASRLRSGEEGGPRLLRLDADAESIEGCDESPPEARGGPDHPAYVIYTSGSTGRPKGVPVSHRQVARLLSSTDDWFGFSAEDVWTLFHSYAFDFSVWEIWGALAYGGRLVVVPHEVSRSPQAFSRLLAEEGVTVLNQTPSAFRQLASALEEPESGDREAPWRLRWVIFGGEALEVDGLRPWLERVGDRGPRLVNMYGITETTVHVTFHPLAVDALEAERGAIGRPIPDLTVNILDPRLEPLPLGRPGEMFVGGAGVARGYLRRPALTAWRFLPDPWAPAPGGRLYRTGDLGRRREDGTLEYLGRGDQQLKIRGFRIEPGEIEAVLERHPAVRRSLVRAGSDGGPGSGGDSLTAYAVFDLDAAERAAAESDEEQVGGWREVFDETYVSSPEETDPAFNIRGWNSSYTGEPIPDAEMREWVETTIERIRTLSPVGRTPRRILEIGCGTGLLLLRLAPHCETYVGTDFSSSALAWIEAQLPPLGLEGVRLERRVADDLDGLEEDAFDAVVINSVAQYFPSATYLERVLGGALRRLAPGGTVFLGDLRSLPLLEALHASVELERSPASLRTSQLRLRVGARVALEEELVLSPAFFHAFAARDERIGGVEIHLRRGRARNELTRFRYDAVLRLGPASAAEASRAIDWHSQELDLERLCQRLAEAGGEPLAVRGIPDARTQQAVRTVELVRSEHPPATVADLRQALDAKVAETAAIDPEELWELARAHDYDAVVSGGSRPGFADVLFRPPGSTLTLPNREPFATGSVTHANRPLAGRALRRLASELRHHAARHLPEHMVPSTVVLIEELPLTAHGKVDLEALPPAEGSRPRLETAYEQPRTDSEERLAAIWSEVLGVEKVGIEDSFFDLGGHSLLATQLIARVRKDLAVDVGLRALFEAPTVAGLAAAVDLARARRAEAGATELPELMPDPDGRHEPFPLTEVQQAYWVGRRAGLELGSVAAHVYMELEGENLDLERVENAWNRLIERHDMLRAVVDDDGLQRVLPRVDRYRIEVADLRELDAEERDARLAELRRRMSHQVLDPATWPLYEIRASRLPGNRLRLHVSLDVLLFDGWSFRLLSAEMARLYVEPEARLEPLEITFRDYVLAQEALIDGELYARSLAYWRSRLDALPPAPELPLAVDSATLEEIRFERFSGHLPAAAWSALKERAAGAGLTTSAVLLAVYAEILARWSRTPRFTLNLTLFNRLPLHPQVDLLLGDFTSLVLLEVDAGERIAFEVRARRLQERLWTDLDHRHVGGVRVLRELAARRGGAGVQMPVVFTSTLNLDAATEAAGEVAAADEPEVEEVYSIGQTPQVWLDHQASELDGELVFNWDTVAGLFPSGLTAAMFAAYRRLLERLSGDPQAFRAPVADLLRGEEPQPAVAPEEASMAPAALLHTLFCEQAARAGERTAIIAGDGSLEYRELEQRSRRLAQEIGRRGARPGTLVAVVAEKGWEQAVAALAVLRSGAAYLPVDPDLPDERRKHLLERGEVRLALTQERLRAELAWPASVEALAIDGEPPADEANGTLPSADPRDLAYVIFTSGSTGEPKGVMIDHRGAVNTIADVNRRFDVGPGDRVLALSSLSFDLSVYDLFGLLAAGGTVVMPEPWATRDPSHWLELLVRERVSVWNSVPALAEMLVEYAEGADASLPESLRLVLLSGDWIPLDLPDRIRHLRPGVEVVSLGGATEASIWSILYPIGEIDPAWTSVPYGRAMWGQSVEVLDHLLELRPVWVPGELYIGGGGVALGYWRDQERTAASFVRHPATGERLYRTGDWGRRLPDGTIEFLGRQDGQVKIQGHRIELGEVEAVLAQHPRLRAAAVVAAGPPRGDRRLVAYVVADGGSAASEPEADGGAAAPASPESVPEDADPELVLDPVASLEFKIRQPGLRRDADAPEVALGAPSWPEESRPGNPLERRSHRRFAADPVPLRALGELLGALTQDASGEGALPRRRYGSAGSLYPVQVYLWIRPGRVEGLEGGFYYHDPEGHRLRLLTSASGLAPERRPVDPPEFEGVAFAVYLIARMEAIRPLYGRRGHHYAVIEAGLITQLLEMTAPEAGLGLCQIGEIDFESIRDGFALDDDGELLHSLVGGVPATAGESTKARRGEDLIEELERFLGSKLPAYMVPHAFVRLEALPLTANGKVDRAELVRRAATPTAVDVAAPRDGAPPRSEIERRVAGVLEELLGLEQVGATDNFFELGGNSVHLVRAHAKLRQLTGAEIPLVEMFNHPTVRSLASYLTERMTTPATPAEVAESSREDEDGERRQRRQDRRRALRRLRREEEGER